MPGIGAPWSYIAELEVHHARIFDCCEPKNGDAPFARLAEQVAALQAFLTLHRYDRPPHKLPIHRPPHHFKINSPWSSQMARSHNCRIMSECDTDSRIFPAFPGLKWDHPRQLAVMHALVRFAKLKAQGSVHKVPNTRRYRLVGKGYSICVVFLAAVRTHLCSTDLRSSGTLLRGSETGHRETIRRSTASMRASATISTNYYGR